MPRQQHGPEGELTATQHEIMAVVWAAPAPGATVTGIWQAVADQRGVTRTTVLNLVDRLEKRGWLVRESVAGVYHYRATISREAAERRLATGFMAEFFGGSPTHLVQSLLGSADVSTADLDRLQKLLDEAKRKRTRGGERPPKGGHA